jgi:hypothetical protein
MYELLQNKYGVHSFDDVDSDMQVNLIKELRNHFNASAKQIARITGCNLKAVVEILG